MRRCWLTAAGRVSKRSIACAALITSTFVWASVAISQVTERGTGRLETGGVYPRLPGAVMRPPAWVATGAPFDVAKFFSAPPRAANAAPIYLDAFFEFSDELAVCFPEGAERDRRRQAAEYRSKRYKELADALFKDEKSVPGATIDEVIALHAAGFKKVGEAQRREKCVFEAGINGLAQLPHLQGARQVTRIAQLRVRREVERRDLDAAIRDIEMVLRLVRDLQPRGALISELVPAAITQVVGADMLPRLLASSALRLRDCDRLLKVLAEHEARSHDGYVEGLRGEYLVGRVTLEELVRHQRELAQRMGLQPGQSVAKAILEPRSPASASPANSANPLPEDVDVRLAGVSPVELSRQVAELNRFSLELLSLDGVPYAERLRKITNLKQSRGDDVLARVVERLQPAPSGIEAFSRGISRARATLHAMECQVALRRWQFSHKGSPRDLASIIRAAGMKSVPLDPYDGKPMRLAMLEGKLVIYSVGRDGKDDGGQKDSMLDMQAGDLIYRLPQAEPQR